MGPGLSFIFVAVLGSGWNILFQILATERLRNGHWTSIYHVPCGLSITILITDIFFSNKMSGGFERLSTGFISSDHFLLLTITSSHFMSIKNKKI